MGAGDLVASVVYEPEPAAAAAARRFVRDTLQAWVTSSAAADGHGLVDDAVLLTSELVTNAVVHAGTPVQVTCRLVDGGVEVMVSDAHPAGVIPDPPPDGHVPVERTNGRGLLLPSALATAWGVTYGRSGKAVWFRLGLAAPAGAHGGAGGLQPPLAGQAALPASPQPEGRAASDPSGEPGYHELLASTVGAARAGVGADAAYALMTGEDGDLGLHAAVGAVPPAEADPPASVVTVPFVVDGRVTGLLAAASAAGRSFGDDEAMRLQRLADRWGPPLERARLRELERVRRSRIGALADARGLLSGQLPRDEVMAMAGRVVVPRLVPWCAVLLREDAGLRTAYARHVEEDLSGALAWLLDQVCETAAGIPLPRLPAAHGTAWRWPLAIPDAADAPEGAAGLAAGAAWCFPLGPDAHPGVFAVGYGQDARLPREVAELIADIACRIGVALASARLLSRHT